MSTPPNERIISLSCVRGQAQKALHFIFARCSIYYSVQNIFEQGYTFAFEIQGRLSSFFYWWVLPDVGAKNIAIIKYIIRDSWVEITRLFSSSTAN